MLITAKNKVEEDVELPTRATYYSLDEEAKEADPKVINYEELLDLRNTSNFSEDISFESVNPDLLPSDTTLRVLRGQPFLEEKAQTAQRPAARPRTRAKGKAMIAVYAAAIVTLLLVVILNAVALVRLSTETAALESRVQEARMAVAGMSSYADSLADPDRIVEAAKELGYTFAE